MTKAQIREVMKQQRGLLTLKEIKQYSQLIQDNLFSFKAYEQCQLIFTYLSMNHEVNTWQFVRKAWRDGKKVYSPRVETKGLEFYEITEATPLIKSKFGVPEPETDEKTRYKISEKKSIDCSSDKPVQMTKEKQILQQEEIFDTVRLMILPGLAFDRAGNRIGYGAGYYDRYLARFSEEHFVKIALAYDFQLLDKIEAMEYDVKADMIITPSNIIYCKSKKK